MPSLIEAVREKYCEDDTATSNNGMILQYVTFKRNETNFVKKDQVPPILILNNFNIDHVGNEEEEIKEICKDVKELDVANNQLTKWEHVQQLFHCCPKLDFLNLSFNNLNEEILTTDFISQDLPVCSNLTKLILIGTNITWKSLWNLVPKLSKLQELHLAKNNFITVEFSTSSSVLVSKLNDDNNGTKVHENEEEGEKEFEVEEEIHPEIKRFVFNENPIESWDEIKKLGKCFPSLEHLGLAETLISSIDPTSYENFPKLKSLSLANAKIKDMHHIYSLQKFPALEELRVQGIMLFNDLTSHERRQLIIALLPNVLKLNGTIITESERDSSERAFIRHFDQMHLEGNKPERYTELIQKHGQLQQLVELDLKPKNKIKLNFIYEEKMVAVKELNVHRTTNEIKILAGRLIDIDPKRLRIFYHNGSIKDSFGGEEMRFPQKLLYSYNASDGDEILIVLKP